MAFWPLNHEDPTIFEHFGAISILILYDAGPGLGEAADILASHGIGKTEFPRQFLLFMHDTEVSRQ